MRRVTRRASLLVSLLVTVSALAGCGGDKGASDAGPTQTETYCKQLKADRTYFSALSSGDMKPDQLKAVPERLHALADAAPEDVSKQWDVLDGTLTGVERSLAEAGISTEDLAGLQNGKLPKGVDMAQLAGLMKKAQDLRSPEVQDAVKAIRAHAKKACGVDLAKS